MVVSESRGGESGYLLSLEVTFELRSEGIGGPVQGRTKERTS